MSGGIPESGCLRALRQQTKAQLGQSSCSATLEMSRWFVENGIPLQPVNACSGSKGAFHACSFHRRKLSLIPGTALSS